jgi:hypothetical protein
LAGGSAAERQREYGEGQGLHFQRTRFETHIYFPFPAVSAI